jgi:putative ABC transport system permease protein
MLYGMSPTEPISVAAGVGIVLLTATVACWIPARRASRGDPVRVLRSD